MYFAYSVQSNCTSPLYAILSNVCVQFVYVFMRRFRKTIIFRRYNKSSFGSDVLNRSLCRLFSSAVMATTSPRVETMVWWRCGRPVTSNRCTSTLAVTLASGLWTCLTTRGQSSQLDFNVEATKSCDII